MPPVAFRMDETVVNAGIGTKTLQRMAALLLVAGLFWLLSWQAAQAQQPAQPFVPGQAAPAQGPARGPLFTGPPEFEFRIKLVLLDQFSFVQHPFFQVTKELDPVGYGDARAAGANMFTAGERLTDMEASAAEKIAHALPPFGLEWVTGFPIPFPRGMGIGFDHFVFPMVDAQVARGVSTVLPIKMDTYMYNLALFGYAFDPREPGLNFFLGMGIGSLEGKLMAEPFAGIDPVIIPFAQRPANSLRMGVETMGQNWGFRYELVVVKAKRVELASNPYCSPTPCDGQTQLNFSGTIMRIAFNYQFD